MFIDPFFSPVQQPVGPLSRAGAAAAAAPAGHPGEAGPRPAEHKQPQIEQVVSVMNDVLQPLGITLEFSRDEATRAVVVRVKDQASGETLRQIPSEAMLRLSAALGDLQGILFDHTA